MKNPAFITTADLRAWIPKRPVSSNKGKNGHVLLLVGSRGMGGAAVLSALGALRAGAGLVTVAIVNSERPVVTAQLPEVLTLSLPETSDGSLSFSALKLIGAYQKTRRISVIAVGPGLSVRPAVARLLKTLVRQSKLPMVIDADGLNNLTPSDIRHTGDRVLTPHPAELGRFLKLDHKIADHERVPLTQKTAADLGVVCLLKGHHTVVSEGRQTVLNPTGNSAMSTGGMGDVLTGIVASLIAQGLSPWHAAASGVYLHGLAADLARISDRGMLAREVADAVPLALRKIHGR